MLTLNSIADPLPTHSENDSIITDKGHEIHVTTKSQKKENKDRDKISSQDSVWTKYSYTFTTPEGDSLIFSATKINSN